MSDAEAKSTGWLGLLQEYWGQLAKAAAWLTGIVGTFLIVPPMLQPEGQGQDPTTWLRLSQFLLAIILGLFFFNQKVNPRHWRRWRYVALALALLGVGLFIAYQALTPIWSCQYIKSPVIVGSTDTYSGTANMLLQQFPDTDCKTLIGMATGHTEQIWPIGQLVRRYIILSALYSLALLALSAAAMATIEYIRAGRARPAAPGKAGE